MNILCICAFGQNRSRMAANILSQEGYETRYRGIDEEAPNPLEEKDVFWADVFVFARERHQKKFHGRFEVEKQEFVLDVTDSLDELPEIWRRAKLMKPEQFYIEYTLPRIEEKVKNVSLALEKQQRRRR